MSRIQFFRKPGDPCPYCKTGTLTPRRGKFGDFLGCTRYPSCAGIAKIKSVESERLEREADRILNEN